MGLLVAVGNLKGGVGKSTLAVNLASAFAAQGRSTVLVDTDPQQSAARWASHRLLPCRVLDAPIRDLAGAGAWVGYVQGIRQANDLVVVDLPAVLTAALAAACLLADAVLIPTATSRVDVTSLQRTLHHLRAARRERDGGAPLAWIVPSRVPRPGLLLRRPDLGPLPGLGEPLTPPMHLDPAWEAAFAAGRWIGDLAPSGRAHRDLQAVQRLVDRTLGERVAGIGRPAEGEALARLAGRLGSTPTRPPTAPAPGATVVPLVPPRPRPAEDWPGPLGPRRSAALPGLGRAATGD